VQHHDPYNYGEPHDNQPAPDWQQPGYATSTVERSTAVTLIGLFYLVTCGLGVLQGMLGVLGALLSMDGFTILFSVIGLAINGFLAYSGYSLYKRENWARQTIIAVNYINIAISIIATLAFGGFAISNGFNDQSVFGGMMLVIFVVLFIAVGFTVLISWLIINKLESDPVVRECTPTSIFHQDHYPHTFE
jgi:hypothetical protein